MVLKNLISGAERYFDLNLYLSRRSRMGVLRASVIALFRKVALEAAARPKKNYLILLLDKISSSGHEGVALKLID